MYYNVLIMAATKRERVQLDMPTRIRDLAKSAASRRGLHLVELVLIALAKEAKDPELAKAIEKELKERRPQGRPTQK
jgi:uncharacterized protein (DUF1778 family)